MSHNCLGHNYVGHDYLGHNYLGHACEDGHEPNVGGQHVVPRVAQVVVVDDPVRQHDDEALAPSSDDLIRLRFGEDLWLSLFITPNPQPLFTGRQQHYSWPTIALFMTN